MKKRRRQWLITIAAAVAVTLVVCAGAVSAGDNGNGTITDGGLVWLKNANCFGTQVLSEAKNSVNVLRSGFCGLRDSSVSGQWRLPTKDELVRRGGNRQGFDNVQLSHYYWTSSPWECNNSITWTVFISAYRVRSDIMPKEACLWPVRNAP